MEMVLLSSLYTTWHLNHLLILAIKLYKAQVSIMLQQNDIIVIKL